MDFSNWALLISGGVTLAGIAYPTYAQSKPGWKIGAWAGGNVWSLWFGMGALAYLAGMANVFGWIGFLGAIPLAFLIGFALNVIVGRHMQLVALPGPILANLWFMA
ncbi:hypothetical protein [Erythrobacter dokdonensis]|nr:hypothetical protein [Erythrobacter dokdonensis]